eukprot:scaffold66499_cov62-Phaeocystis_antarctica.AAC.1
MASRSVSRRQHAPICRRPHQQRTGTRPARGQSRGWWRRVAGCVRVRRSGRWRGMRRARRASCCSSAPRASPAAPRSP